MGTTPVLYPLESDFRPDFQYIRNNLNLNPQPQPEGYAARIVKEGIDIAKEWETQMQTLLLQQQYSFKDFEEISRFVQNHPVFLIILAKTPEITNLVFPGSTLSLELIEDPDSPDEAHLTIFIATNIEFEEAYARMKFINKRWWHILLRLLTPSLRSKINLNLIVR